MAATQDTEITLGTGKMLGIFFALVVLCAVFFGMGFSVGKNSVALANTATSSPQIPIKSGKRPSSTDPAGGSKQPPDMTFYKSVGQNNADSHLSASTPVSNPEGKESTAETVATPANGYFVQVAAVSKQDDAEALVGALKKKQYSAAAAQTPADKLFHVQVGPFTQLKDAEAVRAQLLGDGYNPILKK